MRLPITIRNEARWTVVEVAGKLDIDTAPELREQLIGLIAGGNLFLIVDLQQVEFLDSTALGLLVGARKRLHTTGGRMRLVCTEPRVLKVFQVTGLIKFFGIHDSVGQAIAAEDKPSV